MVLPHNEFQKWLLFILFYQLSHTNIHNHLLCLSISLFSRHLCLPFFESPRSLLLSLCLSLLFLGKYTEKHHLNLEFLLNNAIEFSFSKYYVQLPQQLACPIWILKDGEQSKQLNIHLPLVLYFHSDSAACSKCAYRPINTELCAEKGEGGIASRLVEIICGKNRWEAMKKRIVWNLVDECWLAWKWIPPDVWAFFC